MSRLRGLKDLVIDVVNKGATSVEEIHKSIAKLPFSALEKFEPMEASAKSAGKLQDQTIGAIYDVIRKVNNEVDKIASEILDKAEGVVEEKENY